MFKFYKNIPLAIQSYRITVQTNNKWCAYELNSKFDKTYKIYLKVLSLFDIEKKFTVYKSMCDLLFSNKSCH